MFGILIVIGFRKNLRLRSVRAQDRFATALPQGMKAQSCVLSFPQKSRRGSGGRGGGRGDEKGGEASKYGGSQNLCSENHGCAHQITCYGASSM